jgi:hypothetical protein
VLVVLASRSLDVDAGDAHVRVTANTGGVLVQAVVR